jgi:hypothetical protein
LTLTDVALLVRAVDVEIRDRMLNIFTFSLTQGLLLGMGTCLTYIPAVTVTPGWYDKHRGSAMGIVLSG